MYWFSTIYVSSLSKHLEGFYFFTLSSVNALTCSTAIREFGKASRYTIEGEIPECPDFCYSGKTDRTLFFYQHSIQNATNCEGRG